MNREEIEKLLEQYEWIVDYTIRKDFPIFNEDEDVRQLAMIAAWKGIEKYKEGHGATLESYIRKCITYRLRNELKRRSGPKYALNNTDNVISLDEVLSKNKRDVDCSERHDIIPDKSNQGMIIDLDKFINSLNERDREIIYMRQRGKTNVEIGKKQNVTREAIRQRCDKIKKKAIDMCVLD